MRLETVVTTSRRISETTKRLEKTALLADLLNHLHGDEIDIATAFLSARTRQGRIGAGYSAIREAAADPAGSASLELADVDRAFQEISETSGPGSERRRIELLHQLF